MSTPPRRRKHPATRRLLRAVAALTAVLAVTGLPAAVAAPTTSPATTPGTSSGAPGTNSQTDPVTVRVLDVTPTTPAPSDTPLPLTVTLELTNTTDRTLDGLRIDAARGNPISTQRALNDAIAHPAPPDASLAGRFEPTTPVTTSLRPHATRTVTFESTADRLQDAGLCICQNRIYPLYFAVQQRSASGRFSTLGAGQSFVPAFGESLPAPVRVSWVWPLLDAPHRLADDTVFLDDDLADSVAPGGRLDRLLRVVEEVSARIPMTILADPDLVDELAVMSAAKYQVRTGADAGATKAGKGSDAAKAWLKRLRAVLDANPRVELAFTAYADPAVDALARHGLPWTVSLDQQAQARVTDALGGRTPPTDIAWPADGELHPETLPTLVRGGAHTVLVSDAMLPEAEQRNGPLDALAPLSTPAGPALAAVTSSTLQPYVAQVMSRTGSGLAALPLLVSQVAIRAVADGDSEHYVVMTPPRYLDPDPEIAVRALIATADTIWSRPLPLRTATGTVEPVDHGELTAQEGRDLPVASIGAARSVTSAIPGLTTMFAAAADARRLLGPLPAAVQRAESSAWLADPRRGQQLAAELLGIVDRLAGGVRLLTPTNGTYTLGSQDSPLPISIENTLDVRVLVRVRLNTVGGVPGFAASDIGVQEVAAGAKLGLHIPVQVDRAGRIKVEATLTTPNNVALGAPIVVSVRSTALGTIGKIITIVAGVTLLLALALRLARRVRGRRRERLAAADGAA